MACRSDFIRRMSRRAKVVDLAAKTARLTGVAQSVYRLADGSYNFLPADEAAGRDIVKTIQPTL